MLSKYLDPTNDSAFGKVFRGILAESPAIRVAYAVLECAHWSEDSLVEYDRLLTAFAHTRHALAAAKAEGALKSKIELVRKRLKRGRSIQEIMEDFALKKEEMEALLEQGTLVGVVSNAKIVQTY